MLDNKYITGSISILVFEGDACLFFVFHGQSDRNGNWVYGGSDQFGTDEVAGLEVGGFDDLVDGVGFGGVFSDVVGAVLTFSRSSFVPSMGPFPHLVLGSFCSFFSPPFAATGVFFEIFQHDVLPANGARLGPRSTRVQMFHVLSLRPVVLAIFAGNWFFRAIFFVDLKFSRFDHVLTHRAFNLFMKFFLSYLLNTLCCYCSLISIIFSHCVHFRMLRQQ